MTRGDEEVCDKQVVLQTLLVETNHSYIYDGYIKSNNRPCLVKQYKLPIDSLELKRELKLMKEKVNFLPHLLYGPYEEYDGVFAAFEIHQGQIIAHKPCFNIVEEINIVIQIYKLIKFLTKKSLAFQSIHKKIIRYDPVAPHIQFLELIDLCPVTQETLNDTMIKELESVRLFITESFAWVEDRRDIDDFWLKTEELKFLEFYKQLKVNPLETLKSPLIKEDIKPLSITEELDYLAGNELAF